MSIDGARDLNVFFSSPRVCFGETPPTTTATSLLTFADMVLALDRQNISDNFEFKSLDYNAESDHTYASSGYSRTTRSQTAKAAAHLTSRFSEQDNIQHNNSLKDEDVQNSSGHTKIVTQTVSSKYVPPSSEGNSQHLKGKRCVSVENIYNTEAQLNVNISNRVCEWPEVLPKNSPRKSSSFEEVSCDNKSCLKSSKSSEHVQKAGMSYTLHRFVNNTLEFPCWPRKADHTYATATWDGTAASHSLFEHELRQDSTRQNIIEDQEMEDTDNYYPLQNQCDQLSATTGHQLQNFASLIQKDDHTYVKSNFPHLSSPEKIDTESFTLEADTDTLRTQAFSSATFPRQKMRDDHTYFHSGLSRKSSGSAGCREWASTQTVASSSIPQVTTIKESYLTLNSFSQTASANKDHNYSTSA